ncbi:MAG: ABC transporter ATP-binding protein, partial [Actinomycetota bacterium]|nr:ABC transporter ATP-binding protein [Actinomycetota bacterium]
MAEISLVQLTKSFGDNTVVNSVSLDVHNGEFLVLLGPSGCGKSTILRLIAGLEDASSGEVRIDGSIVNFVPPAQRNAAMVFQNYALYPHRTVRKNIAFPLETAKVPKAEIADQTSPSPWLHELSELLERL